MLICPLLRFTILWLSLISGMLHAAEPLPPEQAFRFTAHALDAGTIELQWQVAPDYYLYRDKFSWSAANTAKAIFPKGEMKDDELFGKVEVYRGDVRITIPLTTTGGTLHLRAQSQGCWDGGICYPPQTHEATIDLNIAPSIAVSPAPTSGESAPSNDDSDGITRFLTQVASAGGASSYGWLLASFFGFGLLLAFTPCMFPMIPILSGIIVQHGHALSHARAAWLSLAYVLGMAVTYALVGIAAGLSGTLLSAALQNVWVLGGFALIFVVLSLSMFGFYELQLPAALQSRLSNTANRQGGSFPAIALMGALSALIVGPCVAAPLAGALLYIAKTGDATLGGIALFVMALGMGAPLLLVGAFSRRLLPKSGPWMTGVNRLFGVAMLATALWLISPVIPVWLAMLGWALLLIIPAVFLRAIDPLPVHAHSAQRLGKGVGIVLLLTGAVMLVGAVGGARDPLRPLGFLRADASATSHIAVSPELTWQKVDSPAALDAALNASDKPVMLDFYADWCVSCKEMERDTFTDPAVIKALSHFTRLKADVTANTAEHKALLSRFDLFGPPGIVFFSERQALTTPRVIGFVPPERFVTIVQSVSKGT
jgi:thioredoxin:protein disulfide reductase